MTQITYKIAAEFLLTFSLCPGSNPSTVRCARIAVGCAIAAANRIVFHGAGAIADF